MKGEPCINERARPSFHPEGRPSSCALEKDLDLSAQHVSEHRDKDYWIDEIAFLESRLNGSQGDIDSDDRAACEEALKAAKANLAASH